MKRFVFEEKERRTNVVFRRGGRIPEPATALNRLVRRLAGGKRREKKAPAVRGRAADSRQNCVVKLRYSAGMAAHLSQIEKYLVREGTDRDGNAAELYGTDIAEYKENMAEKNFRVFLSPQNGATDLAALAKSFVRRLELDTGYKLYWEAANHYNTAHPHVHLVINGRDKNGKDVKFSRDAVKTFMRERARDICTAMNGCRSMKEIAEERQNALLAERLIPFDGKIRELAGGTPYVRLDGIGDKSDYVKRLYRLAAIGLASIAPGGGYRLKDGWEETLRAAGRYGCYLKAGDALRFTDKASLRVYSPDPKGERTRLVRALPEDKRAEYKKEAERAASGTADAGERRKALGATDKKYGINAYASAVKTGIVSKVYTIGEEDSRSHAVLLEGADGRAYFVPLLDRPAVKEGRLVRMFPGKSRSGRLAPVFAEAAAKDVASEAERRGWDSRLALYAKRMEDMRVMKQEEEIKKCFRDAARDLLWTDRAGLRMYGTDTEREKSGEAKGVVTKIYAIGEGGEKSYAALLEGVDGRAYFIPLGEKPEVRERESAAAEAGGRLRGIPGRELLAEAKRGLYYNPIVRHEAAGQNAVALSKDSAAYANLDAARDACLASGESPPQIAGGDPGIEKLRLIHELPEDKRAEYKKEMFRIQNGMNGADMKERLKAVSELDKKYGISVPQASVKGRVREIYEAGKEGGNKRYAALVEGIDGLSHFIPLGKRPDIREGRLVKAVPRANADGIPEADILPANKKELLKEAERRGYDNELTRSLAREEKTRQRDGGNGGIEF
jgi:hypothetical protein